MSIVRTATFVLLAPVAALVAAPEWVDSLGLDVVGINAFQKDLRAELEREEALEITNQEIRRRIEVKDALVSELIGGRTTLARVTDQFLTMNRDRPEYMDVIRATYPGATDEERTAQNVLGYVTGELADDTTPRKAAVLARLEAEFECLKGDPVASR